MAADFSVRVNLDGTQAVSNAKQVGDAMTQMGTAGDSAAQKIAQSAQKMSAPMREATVQAAAAKSMFGELQAAAAKPVAGGGAAGVQPLLAALEKARVFYQQLNTAANETATLGGRQAASFEQAAAAAKGMTDALVSTRQVVSEMVAEGASMAEIYATVKEQITLLEPPLQGVATEAKAAFQAVEAGLEKSIAGTKDFAAATENAAAAFDKEVAAAQKAADAQAAAAQKKQEAEEKAAAAVEAAAQKEAAAEAKATAAAKAEGAALEEVGAHASHGLAGISMMQRGTDDLSRALGLGMGGGVGFAVRGIEDLMKATAQGGAGMLVFAGSMIAMNAAMKAIQAPLDALKEGMDAAAEDEKLQIGLKDVVGSGKMAAAQMEQLKDYITGAGAAFKLSDVAEGVRQLELLTGQAGVTNTQLEMLGAAAQANDQKFSHVAETYARVAQDIELGRPVRQQLLTQMVEEGLISGQTESKILSMGKAHATAAAQLAVLNAGMNQNAATANALADDYDNTIARLKQTWTEDIAAPFGAAVEPVIKNIANELTNMFKGHEGDIQQMADTLEEKLLAVWYYVRDQGVIKSLEDGFSAFYNYAQGTVLPELVGAFNKWWAQAWADFLVDANRVWDAIKARVQEIANFWVQAAKDALNAAQGAVTIPANQALALSMQRGYGTPGEQGYSSEYANYGKSLQDGIDASKQQTDATAKNTDSVTKSAQSADKQASATQQNTTTYVTVNGTLQQVNTSLVALNGALGNLAGLLPGLGGGALAQQPPFPGAVRAESEWKPGEPLTQSVLFGPSGMAMGPNTIAMSLDLMTKYFGSEQAALGKFVDVVDKLGNVILPHQQIRDVSYRSPGVPNVNTIELWGRPDIGYAGVRPEGQRAGVLPMGQPTQGTAWQQAQREAQLQIDWQKSQQAAAQPAKATGAPAAVDTTKATNASKEAMKQLDETIKIVDDDYSLYGKNVQQINNQEKQGIISVDTANQQKLAAAQKMDAEMTKEISTLQAYIAANQQKAKTDQQTADNLDKLSQKVKDLQEKEQALKQTEQELQPLNPFQAFIQGVQQAINSAGTLSTQMENLGKSAQEQFSSGLASAFTAITDGSKTAKQAFLDFAKSFLDSIEQMLIKMAILQAEKMITGMLGGGGSVPAAPTNLTVAAQTGGLVSGPQGVDAVNARLTAGEYVIRKSSVDRLGTEFLENLNRQPSRFQYGGLVMPSTIKQNIPPSTNPAGGWMGAVQLNSTINVGGANALPGKQGAGSMSKQDISQFHMAVNAAIQAEIVKQKRPGGLLNRNSPS